jgi:hypothetical protein
MSLISARSASGVNVDRGRGERAQLELEHAQDLGRFVVDDGRALLVAQRRHGDLAGETWIGLAVHFGQGGEAIGVIQRRRGRPGWRL